MTSSLPNLLIPETALSVGRLTTYIQTLLEENERLQQVWVTGEVSSANRYPSGLFFTLQDPQEKASINCVIWSSHLSKLIAQPLAGEQIIVLGSLRVYQPRGQYQMIVYQALPAGEGLQALRYKQLRDRLASEGLFDPERKLPLPLHPQVVAVVTSPQAAAWGDIQRTLKRRYPGLKILFSPALVQGEQAPESIVAAIARVERDNRAEVIILARGGGAVEDLACFNDERVVRAIANCSIPIVAGIGHQRDESLADLAADFTTPTPTAAATQAVPELSLLEAEHQERLDTLYRTAQYQLQQSKNQLKHLRDRLRRLQVERLIQQQKQTLAWKRHQLLQLNSHRLEQEFQRCEYLQQKLATLDPRSILKRGYAVLRQTNGVIPRVATDINLGEELFVQLDQGQLRVQVIEIQSLPHV